MITQLIQQISGFFSFLVFLHFISDFTTQTESLAKRKSDESPWLLIIHSTLYATLFIPFLTPLLKYSPHLITSCFLILLISHGVIDTYIPIWLWAKFIRRPKEMEKDSITGFTTWMSKPYGMFLTSGIDQLMHITILIPISIMIVVSDSDIRFARTIGFITSGVIAVFATISVASIYLWNKKPDKNQEWNPDDFRPELPSQHD